MSITPPEDYTYGTVTFRALSEIADTADVDRYPNVVAATGTITFTPKVAYYKNLNIGATFMTNQGVIGTLNATGYMVDSQGGLGVVLVDSNSPGISPSGWTYTVTMTINGRTFTPFDITVVGGTTVDLTTIMPASTSVGTVVIVSEASRLAAEDAAAAAAQSAIDAQEAADSVEGGGLPDGGTTGQVPRKNSSTDGDASWATLTKSDVGLSNVDNTADTAKPVSTAQQTALDLKAPLASPTFTGTPVVPGYAPTASPTFTGTVSGVTKAHVGLGSVDNTADTAKPVSTAQQTALDGKKGTTVPLAFINKWTGSAWTYTTLAAAQAAGLGTNDICWNIGNPGGAAPAWMRDQDVWTQG